jgi:hypothetical protein
MRLRSQAYLLLLSALLPETGSGLRQVLGDRYAKWEAHLSAWMKDPNRKGKQREAFEEWAEGNLDPKELQRAKTVYQQAANSVLGRAYEALEAANATQEFIASDGTPFSLFRYSSTIKAAEEAILKGASADIKFSSGSMDTKLEHTTVQGSASGFYSLFSGGASGSIESLNTTAAFSDFEIVGKIGAFANLPVQPVNWFNSAEFGRAYGAPADFTIWARLANAGNWNSFFAQPKGLLARRVSQLVLVSDYDLTVTSSAKYSAEQFTKIETTVDFSIWPFFSSSGKATHTTRPEQGADGSLIVKHVLPKGLIQIWGAFAQDAPQ